MWTTTSTDEHHNMFGLQIARPPMPGRRVHDPYVLFRKPDFDFGHYISIDTLKIMEQNPVKAYTIMQDLFAGQPESQDILELGPEEVEKFLTAYLRKKVELQGIERCFDAIYQVPYHNFYYVEILDIP